MNPKVFGFMVLIGTIIFGWFWWQQVAIDRQSASFDWGIEIAFSLYPYGLFVGTPAAALTLLIGLIRRKLS